MPVFQPQRYRDLKSGEAKRKQEGVLENKIIVKKFQTRIQVGSKSILPIAILELAVSVNALKELSCET